MPSTRRSLVGRSGEVRRREGEREEKPDQGVVVHTLGRHWQESFYKFKAILGNIVRPCLKTKKKIKDESQM